MIIAGHSTPSLNTPGALSVLFHCAADEATPVFMEMEIDTVYAYMRKGETRLIDVPQGLTKEGHPVPLHQLAPFYSAQHKDWGLAWGVEDLPNPAALSANPALPHIKL